MPNPLSTEKCEFCADGISRKRLSSGDFGHEVSVPAPPRALAASAIFQCTNVRVGERRRGDRTDGFPRRSDLLRNSREEMVIRDAVDAVERVGADVRLTQSVNFLQDAREKLADFIDERRKLNSDRRKTNA